MTDLPHETQHQYGVHAQIMMSAHPAGVAPRWGVSSLDWQSHAIDEDAEHPDGVYVARCGQRLVRGTCLYDEAPG